MSKSVKQAKPADSARRPVALTMALLAVIMAAAFLASLALGRYDLGVVDVLKILAMQYDGYDSTQINVVLGMRLPRVVAALLIGAALAGAGCVFQGVFKNPLVSPDLLGASGGAGFGAALAILLGFGTLGVELGAFAMGLVAVIITYALSTALSRSGNSILIMVLSGMVVANLFQALISAVKFVADPNSVLPEITFWLMGGLSTVKLTDLVGLVGACVIGFAGLLVLRWRVNVLSLGDDEALSLGVDVKRTRKAVIAFATLLTAASVSIAGMVGWVGLIIPHLARALVGADQRRLLPASMMLGATFLLVVDDVCRSVYTTEIPLSILTSIIGLPLFIYLITRTRKVV